MGTCDENGERLILVTPTNSTTPVRLTPIEFSNTNSPAGSGFIGRLSLWVHWLPRRGYVMRSIGSASLATGNDNRYWFSADGRNWAPMQLKTGGNPHLYGDDLIAEVDSTGIVGTSIPRTILRRGLLLNPGGTNLSDGALAQQSAPTAPNTVKAVHVDGDGVFRYTADNVALDPQPESMPPVPSTCPIVELTSSTTSRELGRRWVQASGQTSNFNNAHWMKGWVYPLEGEAVSATFRIGSSTVLTTERGPRFEGSYCWGEMLHWGTAAVTNRAAIGLRHLELGANRWLFALESLSQNTLPPYPLAPGQTGANEIATIACSGLGSSYSVAMSMVVPSHAWDAWNPGTHGEFVLASLIQDANDYIEVVYDRSTLDFKIRATAAGSVVGTLTFASISLSKDDPFYLVISSNSTTMDASLSIPQSGLAAIQTATGATTMPSPPVEIALCNPAKTVVVPAVWMAVGYNASDALDSTERAALIKTMP